jgi:hypothetical protein
MRRGVRSRQRPQEDLPLRAYRFVSTVTLLAFLSAAIPHLATAAPNPDDGSAVPAPQSSRLRQSIDRASERAAAQVPSLPARPSRPVRKQMTGGGGGAGMMVMTLLVTAASLAGTYLLVKEMKKSTDEAANAAR